MSRLAKAMSFNVLPDRSYHGTACGTQSLADGSVPQPPCDLARRACPDAMPGLAHSISPAPRAICSGLSLGGLGFRPFLTVESCSKLAEELIRQLPRDTLNHSRPELRELAANGDIR